MMTAAMMTGSGVQRPERTYSVAGSPTGLAVPHDAEFGDHATMIAEFREMPAAPNEARQGASFVQPFAEGGETAARMRWPCFRVVVDTTIAGRDAVVRAGNEPERLRRTLADDRIDDNGPGAA